MQPNLQRVPQPQEARQTTPGIWVLPRMFSDEHIEQLIALKDQSHHEDDGGHHAAVRKPHALRWVAALIVPHIPRQLDSYRRYAVDQRMKIYHLQEGRGAVKRHVDPDFAGPEGSVARYSVLVYLNDEYEGGETVFRGGILAPDVEVGGGLLFRHDILHEGLAVKSGIKRVLKTDVFVR